ncbi:type IV toxin-antitoxin system AbiEi family antitoxin domain-containing protein [Mumia quercus]|uniref:type IV toxin-antitoxin system AbiEi family antitoxin domain-containing protein n=1 Tax=Mumia quercus TaxID=2976125 RepID=UPI003559171C
MDHSARVERLQRVAREQGGYLTRQDGKDCGYPHSELGRLVERKVLVRLRRGAFAFAEDHVTWSPRERHLVTARRPRPARARVRAVPRQRGRRARPQHVRPGSRRCSRGPSRRHHQPYAQRHRAPP